MATETTSKTFTYNLNVDPKEEWYTPEFWRFMQISTGQFKAFVYNDDDVIVCTYPRSGTHMTWLLVRYLLQGNTEPINDAMEDSHLPPIKPDNAQSGRRVFNSHYIPAFFRDELFMNGKQRFIYVSRNPKDVIVSQYHMVPAFRKVMLRIPETWEEWVSFVLTTDISFFNWFSHMRAWEEFLEANPGAPVLELKFEAIVRDPETAIKKMATFLEVPLNEKFLQDLFVASRFENMKDAPVTEMLGELMGPEANDVKYYRKGKIGDWVNSFTVAQNELFDTAYKEQMKGSKVTNIYH